MKIEIELPDDVIEKLKKEKGDMGFDSLEELVEFIVMEYLSGRDTSSSEEMQEKLRKLGYF